MNAVKVQRQDNELDSIIVTATEEFCEKRAPALQRFIQNAVDSELDWWEANPEDGWYSLTLAFVAKLNPDRYEGDEIEMGFFDVTVTCYSCLRIKPTLV